jgi:hypothetical protein
MSSLVAARRPRWTEIEAKARYVAISPDGDRLAISCADGGVWLYRIAADRWSFLAAHDADVVSAHFSPDGAALVTPDVAGLVVLHPLSEGDPP